MKVHFDKDIFVNEEDAKKAYFCDACGEEVWSLICHLVDGKEVCLCDECHQKGNPPSNIIREDEFGARI